MKIQEFKKVASMLAKEHRISIQPGERWAADIKNRNVYYVNDDIFNLTEEHILGMLLHEIAHIHYTTETTEQTKDEELMHSAMNMIEDISIENIISKDYPNAGEILSSTKQEVLDTLVKMLPKLDGANKHEKAMLFAAARFENRGSKDGTRDYEKVGYKIEKIMKIAENKELILNRTETEDLLPLARQIVDLLNKELGELTDSEKENMKETQQRQDSPKEQYVEGKKGAKEQLIDQLKKGTGWKGAGKTLCKNIKMINEIIDQADQVGKKLRTVLKRNNAMEFGGRYRTGKLVTKSFLRIRALRDRNPFTRRIVKSNQSYAFTIALDVSGSMVGPNLNYATSSMIMVAEALKYAGIPRGILIFGERTVLIKRMSKEQLRWEEVVDEKMLSKAYQGGTEISTAMGKSRKELEEMRAERKIMIVLTDGSSCQETMEEEYAKAKKKGIECIGITIGNDGGNVMDNVFGKNNIAVESVDDPNEITKAFLEILKSTIKKSNT